MAVIGTCLWFNDQAEEAARFYTGIFPNSSVGDTSYYPEGTPAPFPPGSVMIVEFTLDGRPFMGLNGGPQFPFSEAISMPVDCADQAEIDHYRSEERRVGRRCVSRCRFGWSPYH